MRAVIITRCMASWTGACLPGHSWPHAHGTTQPACPHSHALPQGAQCMWQAAPSRPQRPLGDSACGYAAAGCECSTLAHPCKLAVPTSASHEEQTQPTVPAPAPQVHPVQSETGPPALHCRSCSPSAHRLQQHQGPRRRSKERTSAPTLGSGSPRCRPRLPSRFAAGLAATALTWPAAGLGAGGGLAGGVEALLVSRRSASDSGTQFKDACGGGDVDGGGGRLRAARLGGEAVVDSARLPRLQCCGAEGHEGAEGSRRYQEEGCAPCCSRAPSREARRAQSPAPRNSGDDTHPAPRSTGWAPATASQGSPECSWQRASPSGAAPCSPCPSTPTTPSYLLLQGVLVEPWDSCMLSSSSFSCHTNSSGVPLTRLMLQHSDRTLSGSFQV